MLLRNFSDVEDSDSCGNSWCDLLEDYCGLSECVLEVSSGVLVVTDVLPDHLLRCLCRMKLCCRTLIGRVWNRSPFFFSRQRQASCV